MPNMLKMNYQTKHFIKKHSIKAHELERKCKKEVLSSLLDYCRKRFIVAKQQYDVVLGKYVEDN